MKVICPVPPATWDRICTSQAATFFHTRAWADVLSRTFPYLRVATRAFTCDSGTTALLPLMSKSTGLKGLFRSYESMVPGVYGSLLADGDVTQSDMRSVLAP